jgi:hypothetical protein
MVLTRALSHITQKSIDEATEKNMRYLESKQSGIRNGGTGLFTRKKLVSLQPIGWYEGEVHSGADCEDNTYCASLNGIHIDPRKTTDMLRYANDAYRNKNKSNNAKMEFLLRKKGGGEMIPWPFLYARVDIEPGNEILYSYGDKYWRNRKV